MNSDVIVSPSVSKCTSFPVLFIDKTFNNKCNDNKCMCNAQDIVSKPVEIGFVYGYFPVNSELLYARRFKAPKYLVRYIIFIVIICDIY